MFKTLKSEKKTGKIIYLRKNIKDRSKITNPQQVKNEYMNFAEKEDACTLTMNMNENFEGFSFLARIS